MRKIGFSVLAVMLLLFSGIGVAMAQPNVVTLSDLIEINAEPASIPADGVSTSNVTIAVFWPDLEELGNLSGIPAANTRVDVWTTLGKLTDAKNVSNTGEGITSYTNDNGTVSVLLSGNETGVVNITARATGIEDRVNDILANETTVYVVKNSTTVTFFSEELSIEAEKDVIGKGEDMILTVNGNLITYYYLIVTNVDVTAPPAIEYTGDVKALDTAGDAYPATGTPNLAAWIKTGSDGIADVKVATSGADERTYTIKVYYEPENSTGSLTPITDFVPDEEIVMCEDDDNIDIEVTKAKVTFDMPTKAVIGEEVTIKGVISAGDVVDILIDDGDIEYFDDEPVDEDNEFEVEWDTAGLRTGIYTIDVYIDCPYDSYDEIEAAGIDDDGKITIRLIYPLLTINLSTNITQPGGTIVINGTAMGTDHVDIITISPGGGNGMGLYEKSYPGVPGITNESIPVENNSFSKTINVSECATPTPTPTPTIGRGGGGGGGGGGGVPRDSDGDGISDIAEMLAGTDKDDPCDPNPECAACLAMSGAYIIWVSVPGHDGEYGAWSTAENASELIKHIIDDYCGGNVSELRSKTREQILAILQNATIDRAGSDGVACVMELNVHNFSITVSPLAAVLYVGETKQFNATAYDQYVAEMPDIVFAWASSSETVGTVGATTGLFTALAVGTTTITATNGTVSGTASVTVKRHYAGGRGAAPRDSDGDGYSDIEEMLAGTDKDDPCDPNPDCAACLAIRPPTPTLTPTLTSKPTVTLTPTMPPTAAAATPTPTATPTPPGFEAVFTIAGLLAVAYLVLRRKRK